MLTPRESNLSSLNDDTVKKERRTMMSVIPDLVQSDSDCLNDYDDQYENNRIDDDSDDDASASGSDDKSVKEENQSSSSSSSKNTLHQPQEEECDACPCCEDVCGSNCCQSCIPTTNPRMMNDNLTSGATTSSHRSSNSHGGANHTGSIAPWRRNDRRIGPSSETSSSPASLSSANSSGSNNLRYFTMCEIRRHNTHRSIWLVAGKKVYDVTDYMKYHPGGQKCFLSKAGGARDVTRDLNFHSKRGQKLWQKFHIGYVKECPSVLQSSASSLPFQNGDSNDVSRGIAAAGVTSNTSPRTWCFLPKFWEMR